MKSPVTFLSLVIVALGSSMASAGDVKECWFDGHGKDDSRCKVRLVEDERATALDESPISIPTSDRDRVKLFVDCCDFDLNDEHATQIDKRDDEMTVGTDRGKLAVLVIEDGKHSANDRDRDQKAVLTISGGHGHDSFARRLVGECKKKGRD